MWNYNSRVRPTPLGAFVARMQRAATGRTVTYTGNARPPIVWEGPKPEGIIFAEHLNGKPADICAAEQEEATEGEEER